MKKIKIISFVSVAIFIVLISCTKKEDYQSLEATVGDVTKIPQKSGDNTWKWPNIPFTGDDEPGCIQGWANCLEFCCVTPKIVADFVEAIDTGRERTFLSDTQILIELGQGFEYYEQLLEDVRDGSKSVIYYKSPEFDRIMLLYGDSVVSLERFEGAQALRL
jgi:hypothetical protein